MASVETENRSSIREIRTIIVGADVPKNWIWTIKTKWPEICLLDTTYPISNGIRPDLYLASADSPIDQFNKWKVIFEHETLSLGVSNLQKTEIRPFDIVTFSNQPSTQIENCIENLDKTLSRLRKLKTIEALARAKVQTLTAELKRIDDDLKVAKSVQMSGFEKNKWAWKNGEIATLSLPLNSIGGDIVAFKQIDDSGLGFVSVDVSGHGVASALLATNVSNKLGDLDGLKNPSKMAESLNDWIFHNFDTELYFTALLGFLDFKTNTLVFCQAGHPSPIIFSSLTSIVYKATGLPIGLVPGAEYENQTMNIERGARILVCSDGFSECVNHSDSIEFGTEGLAKFLDCTVNLQPEKVLKKLDNVTQNFSNGQRQDDASAIIIDYNFASRNFATA